MSGELDWTLVSSNVISFVMDEKDCLSWRLAKNCVMDEDGGA